MFRRSGEKLYLSSGIASATSRICFSMASMSWSTTDAIVGGACWADVTWRGGRMFKRSAKTGARTVLIKSRSVPIGFMASVPPSFRVSTRRKIVPHHLAVFHHEAHALEFRNVGDGITTDRD